MFEKDSAEPEAVSATHGVSGKVLVKDVDGVDQGAEEVSMFCPKADRK